MLDLLRQDTRYAARALGRSPLFAIVSVLSIAIGVGATTAIVTLANTLLLRPPPEIGHPERVVAVGRTNDGRGFDNFSYPDFLDYREATSMSALAAMRMDPTPVSLAGPSGGEPVQMSSVSGNFFAVLEAKPALGRFFSMAEDREPGADPVVVLSHRFWTRRYQADPAIVGKPIVLNGTPFTVVGVAGDKFQGPFVIAPDMWVPMMGSTPLGLTASMFSQRNAVWMVAIGRLAPNVGIAQAQAELSAISTRLNQQYRANDRTTRGVVVTPVTFFPANMRPVIGGFMMLLLAVAGLVLVIASTNVAGMMLARASARRREIAVRLALGASRKQLVIQLVIESLLVFIAAAVAGLVVANWLVAGLMALVPKLPVQLLFDPQLDWRVLSFTLAMSLVTGVLAGLVPAMQSTRPDLVPALKSDGGGTATKQRMRLRSGLLVTQIAFSMLLLIVAGLFARTLSAARGIAPGFDPRGVYIASLNLDLANYDSTTGLRTVSTMLERVRSTPGVQSVATAAMLPLDGGGMGLGGIQVNGRRAPNGEPWDMDWNVVTPDYFATLSIPIVRGRAFSETERVGSDVAILNETFAAALFPGEDAVGRLVMNDDRPLTVVGIAKDAKYRTLGETPRNFIYVPLSQRYMGRMHVLIKTAGAVPVATAMRRIMAEVDPALPILNQQSMVDQTRVSLFPQTLALYVSGGLGGVALLLALLGIYGVTAFSVSQRTREIGVRVALGAQRSHVLGLVVRQGVVLAGIGVVVGSLAGFGATRLISSLLYGIAPTDLVAFGGAAALLAAAALVASWIPARRASRVDPVIALKSE